MDGFRIFFVGLLISGMITASFNPFVTNRSGSNGGVYQNPRRPSEITDPHLEKYGGGIKHYSENLNFSICNDDE